MGGGVPGEKLRAETIQAVHRSSQQPCNYHDQDEGLSAPRKAVGSVQKTLDLVRLLKGLLRSRCEREKAKNKEESVLGTLESVETSVVSQ